MNDVKFKFDAPEHGWMGVSITDGADTVSLDISDVPCNSIYNLVVILLGIQSGVKSQEVEFSLEPHYALWKFLIVNEDLEVYVFASCERSEPVVFKGKKEKIVQALYESLRDLEALQCWKEPDAKNTNWSWEFPSDKLNIFRERSNRA